MIGMPTPNCDPSLNLSATCTGVVRVVAGAEEGAAVLRPGIVGVAVPIFVACPATTS